MRNLGGEGLVGMRLAQLSNMTTVIAKRTFEKPWLRPAMTAEQADNYRKAIAPLQKTLAAPKAARLELFKWLRGRVAAA